MKAENLVLMAVAMMVSCGERQEVENEVEGDPEALTEAVVVDSEKEVAPLSDEQLEAFKEQSWQLAVKVGHLRNRRERLQRRKAGIEGIKADLERIPEMDAALDETKANLKRLAQEWEDHLDRTNQSYVEEPPRYPAKRARELIAGFDDELAGLKKENAELREKLGKKEGQP